MLNALYNFIARATVVIHGGLRHVTGDNGYTWALSIIVLVMGVRLLLVPLFVKQIKSQRTMQLMQPKIKELRDKYKNDKQKMNEEMIKLQKEHGNPLLGCLPTVLQIPLFLALYRVMNGFEPQIKSTAIPGQINGYYPKHLSGLSVAEASQIAHAKIFGASLATTINSSQKILDVLGSDAFGTRVVCGALIVIMMVTTFLTQRQIMGRNAPAEGQQATVQKVMLYGAPIGLGVFSLRISIGGLLYYFTSNLWSMAQQFVVIRRMPPVVAPGEHPPPAAAKPAPTGGLLGVRRREPPPPAVEPTRRLVQQRVRSGSAQDVAPGGMPAEAQQVESHTTTSGAPDSAANGATRGAPTAPPPGTSNGRPKGGPPSGSPSVGSGQRPHDARSGRGGSSSKRKKRRKGGRR